MRDGQLRIIGTSSLLTFGPSVVLEVQKQRKWAHSPEDALAIGIGCIGGSRENDETVIATLRRECAEEIACEVKLRSAEYTIDISPTGLQIYDDLTFDGLRPAMVWEDAAPGLMPELVADVKVAVFLGMVDKQPKPVDLPAILYAPSSLICELADGDCTVGDLRSRHAKLEARIDIPPNARLEPVGTLKHLIHLRRTDPQLYKELTESIYVR